MPVYLIRPVFPSPETSLPRRFVCEDDPQALDLAFNMARAGLTIEVWRDSKLVGSASAGST